MSGRFTSPLTHAEIQWAAWQKRSGVSTKEIASALEVSRRTIWRRLRSLRRPRRESVGESLWIASLKGAHRVHAAHAIEDLWELVHIVVAEARFPTLADLSRIRGDGPVSQSEASVTRAFYRIKDMLDEQGLRFEKRIIEGEPSIRIEFDVQELSTFVRREIGLAGRVIEEYAKRTGNKRRFRGR